MPQLAIVGAGNMGTALARLFAMQGWRVTLIDASTAALERARGQLAGIEAVFSTALTDAADATLVIEAVPENAGLKRAVFESLEDCCAPDTLIASNTSGLSIDQLAAGLRHPGRFVGTHFFTPADVIPLVEVVAGKHTLPATSESMMAVLHSIGKRPVLVRKDIPGFIANRLQHALAREAMSLLENGVASAEDIDTVAKWSIGIRLALTGPLEQRDINGLDVHHAIASYLYADLENTQAPLAILRHKVEQGHIGAKAGQGFYDWRTPDRRDALQVKEADLRALVDFLNARSASRPS